MASKPVFQRLPVNVAPVNYDIRLKPDLVKFTFEGSQKILLRITEATDRIVMNAKEIQISKDNLSVTLKDRNKGWLGTFLVIFVSEFCFFSGECQRC